ncbi:MAG: phosphate acyltransferase, partial [Eubacterium sp.]
MKKGFEDLISKVGTCSKKTVAVAVAQDEPVLEAVKSAKERGIADAILVGDQDKIAEVAEKLGMDLSDYRIIHEPDNAKAAMKASELVHNKEANMLM